MFNQIKFLSFSAFILSAIFLLAPTANAQCFQCESIDYNMMNIDPTMEDKQLAPKSYNYINPNPTYANLHNYNTPYYYNGGAWDSSMPYHYNGYEVYNHPPYNSGKTHYSKWRHGGRYSGYERGSTLIPLNT